MTLSIFFLVLGAAVLHACWNALVKGGTDKALNMSAVVVGQGLFGIAALAFAPLPSLESWPYLVASVAVHLGYQKFLMDSYKIGDLTQVYPIARGTAPMLVALVSLVFLGVTLSPGEYISIAMIGIGLLSLGLVRQRDGMRNGRAALLAATTGCFIAGYSLIDGLGARVAGSALGFYGVGAGFNALFYCSWLLYRDPRLVIGLPSVSRVVIFGGGTSFVAYALVVYAFTQAPIALVTALRETSIIWALLIGVFFLRERLDLSKVAATAITLAGAAILRFSKSGG